jgi:hypothetical protein
LKEEMRRIFGPEREDEEICMLRSSQIKLSSDLNRIIM